jgi:hypothetical protein
VLGILVVVLVVAVEVLTQVMGVVTVVVAAEAVAVVTKYNKSKHVASLDCQTCHLNCYRNYAPVLSANV